MPDQYSLDDGPELQALRACWEQALKLLGDRLPATTMTKFINLLEPEKLENGAAVFAASSQFVQSWIQDKYLDAVIQAVNEVLGKRTRVEIVVRPKDRPRYSEPVLLENLPALKRAAPAQEINSYQPNPDQTFDTFVVGPNNRLAEAGARAVCLEPGEKYNPLFIYSKPGLGKTHLLNSIAYSILAARPQLGVAYTTGQKFTEDYVAAVQTGKVEQFRKMIRNAGVWLLDDVQFILGREKTQEEVFHLFNSLHEQRRQIVVCSDRPPRDLLGAHERLRSRFEMGLVADMEPPDTETRTAIVLKKAEQRGVLLSPAVALCIADLVVGSVRHLEGALHKVLACAKMDDVPPSVELAREVCLTHYKNLGPVKPTFQQILSTVCRQFRVEPEEVLGTSRKANIAMARHVAVYAAREILKDSWKHIGASFGDKDHTTMMHGYKKVRDQMDRDREFSAVVNSLVRDLYPEQ